MRITHNRRRIRRRCDALRNCALACGLSLAASAETLADVVIEESYTLASGWNLIHVPVEPSVKDPHQALAGVAWESLWAWLPSAGEARGGRWLAVYRDAPAFLNSLAASTGTSALFSFSGPGSYLLLAPAAGTLRVKGTVRASRPELRGGAFQLFGPSFDRAGPPTFAGYFSRPGVKEHIGAGFELVGQSYRRLGASDRLRPGAAYWLLPQRDIPSPDPLRLSVGVGGLRFDAQTTVGEVVLDVGDGTEGEGGGGGLESRLLHLRAAAVVPPGGQDNTDWIEIQGADGAFSPLGSGASIEIAPAQSVVRVSFRAARPNASQSAAADQQAVNQLTTAHGQVVVAAELDVPSMHGTWIGDATITEVERHSLHGGGFGPAPELAMALILEVPAAGQARLLPCVQVETPRDGRSINYRLESALFHEAMSLLGSPGQDGTSGVLAGTADLPAGHPLNPYRHRYHPEHGVGFDITRTVRMEFGASLPGGAPGGGVESPVVSVGTVTGVFNDEIVGLTPEPIRLRGQFRLRRLSAGAASPCGGGAQ